MRPAVLACSIALTALAGTQTACGLAQTLALVLSKKGGGGGSSGAPSVPAASVDPIARSTGSVAVVYRLSDARARRADVEVSYSTDGGATFLPATLDAAAGEGTTGLAASPEGTPHVFLWDAARDLGPGARPDVRVRVVPSRDGRAGPAALAPAFAYGNDAPDLALDAIEGPVSGFVRVATTIADSTGDDATLSIAYSADGLAFAPITVVAGDVTGLATSPAGVPHSLLWNTVKDLGARGLHGTVRLRAEATDAFGARTTVFLDAIAIGETSAPAALLRPIPAPVDDVAAIPFAVADAQSDTASVLVEWREAGAASFRTADGGPASGLATSPDGVEHVFAWPLPAELRDGAPHRVRIRVTPFDAAIGQAAEGDLVIGAVPPEATITTPEGTQRGLVIVDFSIASATFDPARATLEVLRDTGAGLAPAGAATIAAGPLADLATTPAGTAHRVVWNALADLGEFEGAVQLRLTPETSLPGAPTTTAVFAIDIADEPLALIVAPAEGALATSPVPVRVLAIEPQGRPIDLAPQYSLDGKTFHVATLAGGSGPLVGLAASPEGVVHALAWDARADIGTADADGVRSYYGSKKIPLESKASKRPNAVDSHYDHPGWYIVWRYIVEPTESIEKGKKMLIARVDIAWLTKEDWKYCGSTAGATGGGRTHTFTLKDAAKRFLNPVYQHPGVVIRAGKFTAK